MNGKIDLAFLTRYLVSPSKSTCRYLQYQMLKTLLNKHVCADDRILIPGRACHLEKAIASTSSIHATCSFCAGCGLSLLGEEMAAEGYRSLLAVDYSETCIQVLCLLTCTCQTCTQLLCLMSACVLPLQTMQNKEIQEHQDTVVYSIMDVTALQLEV